GTVGSRRTMNHLLPERWCAAVEAGEETASNVEEIDAVTARAETMMLGLRLLNQGVKADAFAARHGLSLDDAFGEQIADLRGLGLLEPSDGGVRLTARGLLLAN